MDRSSIPISNDLYLLFGRAHLNKEAHIFLTLKAILLLIRMYFCYGPNKEGRNGNPFFTEFFTIKRALRKVPFTHRKRISDNADQLADAIGRLIVKLDTTYAEAMGEIGNLKNRSIAEIEAVRHEIGTYTLERGAPTPNSPP